MVRKTIPLVAPTISRRVKKTNIVRYMADPNYPEFIITRDNYNELVVFFADLDTRSLSQKSIKFILKQPEDIQFKLLSLILIIHFSQFPMQTYRTTKFIQYGGLSHRGSAYNMIKFETSPAVFKKLYDIGFSVLNRDDEWYFVRYNPTSIVESVPIPPQYILANRNAEIKKVMQPTQ